MNYRAFVIGSATVLLSLASLGIHAQETNDENPPPAFEHYTIAQRIDPASGVVFADGRNYYLQASSRIWIGDKEATRNDLTPIMLGSRIGLDAYEDGSRYLITKLQVLTKNGGQPPEKGGRP